MSLALRTYHDLSWVRSFSSQSFVCTWIVVSRKNIRKVLFGVRWAICVYTSSVCWWKVDQRRNANHAAVSTQGVSNIEWILLRHSVFEILHQENFLSIFSVKKVSKFDSWSFATGSWHPCNGLSCVCCKDHWWTQSAEVDFQTCCLDPRIIEENKKKKCFKNPTFIRSLFPFSTEFYGSQVINKYSYHN